MASPLASSGSPGAVLDRAEDRRPRDRSQASQRVKDLAASFRRAGTAVRVPYRDRLRYWLYYIALAHRGKMVPSATHDAQYADGFLKRGYDKYCERINRRLARAAPPDITDVPCFAQGELGAADLELLMRARIPFVLRDGARGLPIQDWTLDYLEEVAGDCEVPINGADDRPSTELDRPTKADRYYDFRTGKLSEVVASIRAGGNLRVSVAEDVMHHDGGRLRQGLGIPYWEQVSGWDRNQHHWLRSRLFIGKVFGAQLLVQPESAFTLWHAEPGDSFFVLSKGEKTWTLAHPLYTAAMRPRVKTTTNYTGSNIDLREPDDLQRRRGFNGYPGIPKVRVRLRPGDVLRVPNNWWHSVVTHPGHYTMAVTLRLESGPNLVGAGFSILRLFDKQAHAMIRAFDERGRITDHHIGYPRKSRSAAGSA